MKEVVDAIDEEDSEEWDVVENIADFGDLIIADIDYFGTAEKRTLYDEWDNYHGNLIAMLSDKGLFDMSLELRSRRKEIPNIADLSEVASSISKTENND